MKRKLLLTLCCIVLLLITACNAAEPNPSDQSEKGIYVDGEYTIIADHVDSHGWAPMVKVTIADGKITSGKMDYMKPGGDLKSEDESYAISMSEQAGIKPKEAYDELNKRIIEAQQANVEAVSGATSSSNWFNKLASIALEKAETGEKGKFYVPLDDSYSASNEGFDEQGRQGEISITYSDNKIASVEYTEVNKQGNKKEEDESFQTQMKSETGVSWNEAVKQLEEQLVEEQDYGKVDAVTGATHTSENFKTLAQQAIESRVPMDE